MSDPTKPLPAPPPSGGSGAPPFGTHDEASEVPWTGLSILVVVAGLILFMAIPMRPPTAERIAELRAELMADTALARLELAIQDYRHDHGEWPGSRPQESGGFDAPSFDTVWLTRHLRMASNRAGQVAPRPTTEHAYGPYLPGELPVNPHTGLRTVRVLTGDESFDSVRDGIYGWLYRPKSGEVRAHRLPFTLKHASTPSR